MGCQEKKRHEVLDFFFDGVPPLEGEPGEQTPVIDPRTGEKRPEVVWFVHEPQPDCARCHGDRKKRSFSSEVKLVAPLPDLCFQCHEKPSKALGWIHGPVAAGECVFCHEPHRTVTPHLLKKPVPELCFRCHDIKAVHAIAQHDQPSYAACLECHVGHASPEPHLLKQGVIRQGENRDIPVVDSMSPQRNTYLSGLHDARQHQDLHEIGKKVASYIQARDYESAKAYLLGAQEAGVFSEQEVQIIQTWLDPIQTTLDQQRSNEKSTTHGSSGG